MKKMQITNSNKRKNYSDLLIKIRMSNNYSKIIKKITNKQKMYSLINNKLKMGTQIIMI
jgi:hypothetical protein